MKYIGKILPLYEAITYLVQRFDQKRTSVRIEEKRRLNKAAPTKIDWSDYQSITDLEKELDTAFEPSELMRFYFSPLETQEKYHSQALTLGSLLFPTAYDADSVNDFDDLIDQLNSSTAAQRFHLYRSRFFPFSGDPEIEDYSFPDFLKVVDEVLVKKEDKWNLIDVVSHPVEHLQRLRPLCIAVANYIGNHVDAFEPLLERCCSDFSNPDLFAANLHILSFNLNDEDVSRVVIHPSLFLFDSFSLVAQDGGDINIQMGVFATRIIEGRLNQNNPETHIILLKLLADATRLKALHSLCDKYSYGQELAEKLGSAKNAMYYHLEKMFSAGLLDLKLTDYRMLYTMNKKRVYDQLTSLRDYLVNGWKPEDDQHTK